MTTTTRRERDHVVDVLRGIAVLGILVVNSQMHVARAATGTDTVVMLLVALVFSGKFYPVFAMLFGFGVADVHERHGLPVTTRRLAFLFAFAIALFVFVDQNHILLEYALLGWLLVPARRLSTTALLASAFAALALSVVPWYQVPLWSFLDSFRNAIDSLAISDRPDMTLSSYSAWVSYRARLLPQVLVVGHSYNRFHILGMMLIGTWLSRVRAEERAALCAETLAFSAGAGLVMAVSYVLVLKVDGGMFFNMVRMILSFGAGSLLAWAYLSLTTAALRKSWFASVVKQPVASAGKMAFTNFICQSAIIAVVFPGYGFGLEKRLGLSLGFLMAIAIWLAQVAVSHAWLRSHAAGPFEALWRLAMYGRRAAAERTYGFPEVEAVTPSQMLLEEAPPSLVSDKG